MAQTFNFEEEVITSLIAQANRRLLDNQRRVLPVSKALLIISISLNFPLELLYFSGV
jgi:hypothetical protein